MLVKLAVGTAYKFVIEPPFDIISGVYVVNGILSYQEISDLGIDISETYTRYNVPGSVLDGDINTIRTSSILKLIDPDDAQMKPIYLPSMYVVQVPDHNVRKYRELVLAVNLGIFNDAPILDSIGENITEYLKGALGVDTPPKLFETKHVWMTDSEYAELSEERWTKAAGVVNYFSECVRLRNEVDRLRNRLAAYEDKFFELSAD